MNLRDNLMFLLLNQSESDPTTEEMVKIRELSCRYVLKREETSLLISDEFPILEIRCDSDHATSSSEQRGNEFFLVIETEFVNQDPELSLKIPPREKLIISSQNSIINFSDYIYSESIYSNEIIDLNRDRNALMHEIRAFCKWDFNDVLDASGRGYKLSLRVVNKPCNNIVFGVTYLAKFGD
jgi:hypothetical protein